MSPAILTEDQTAHDALEFYERHLKSVLEPDHLGEEVAVYLAGADWEVAPTGVEAETRLRVRHPEAEVVLMTVGEPVMDWPWINVDAPLGKH